MEKPNRLIFPALAPVYASVSVLSWPLVRIMFGFFFIPHGCQKLFGWFGGNIANTAKSMENVGLTPGLAWAYYVGTLELVGGVLLIVGLFTRPVAALLGGFMFVATFFAHWQFGYFWTARGFSVPLLLLVLSIAIVIRGGGELSLDRKIGREF